MLLSSLLYLVISSAVTIRRDKSILFSRIAIQSLIFSGIIVINSLDINTLEEGIGIYGGLFNVTTFSQIFNLFIISAAILIITLFYTKKICTTKHESLYKIIFFKFLSKNLKYFRIEYSLIILYITILVILLIITNDLISILLSIELQSYGLYIVSTLYRDSKSTTASILIFFLLGKFFSCFILLGSALLYANSGATSLYNLYIMTSLNELHCCSLSLYQPHYFNLALIIMLVGFLFKISAASFYIWSIYIYDGMPAIVTTYINMIVKSNNIFNETSLISLLLYVVLVLKLSCGRFILSNFSNIYIFEIVYLLGCFTIGLSVFAIRVLHKTNQLPNKINTLCFFIKSVFISSFVLLSRDQFFGLSIDLIKYMPEVFIIVTMFKSFYIFPAPSILPDQSGESSSNPSSSNKNVLGYGVSYLEGKNDSKCYPIGDGSNMRSYDSFLGYGIDPAPTDDSMIPLPPKLCKIPILGLLTPKEILATENYWLRQLYVANKLSDSMVSNIEKDHRITIAILDAQRRGPINAMETENVLNSVRRIREGCNYLDLWDRYKNSAIHNLKQTDFGYLTKMEVDKDYTPLLQKSQALVGHLRVEE